MTGLMWLTTGTAFGFHKMREDPLLAEELFAVKWSTAARGSAISDARLGQLCRHVVCCQIVSGDSVQVCWTLVCLRAASIVPLFYKGHWSMSTAVECKLRCLYVPIVTHFAC